MLSIQMCLHGDSPGEQGHTSSSSSSSTFARSIFMCVYMPPSGATGGGGSRMMFGHGVTTIIRPPCSCHSSIHSMWSILRFTSHNQWPTLSVDGLICLSTTANLDRKMTLSSFIANIRSNLYDDDDEKPFSSVLFVPYNGINGINCGGAREIS
ncbi:hypothetical protein BLOT_000717, partial [Blomia tropicalis]